MKLTNEEYFSNPALNFSRLVRLLKSPKHFWEGGNKEPSKAMELGSTIHCALLEPIRFCQEYIADPGLDKRTKAYKEWEKQVEGKIPYDAIVVGGILRAIQEAEEYSEAIKLINKGETLNEEAIFFEDKGLRMKAKIDAFSKEEKMLIDIKTTNDIEPNRFSRVIFDRAYHLQLAHYGNALKSQGIDIEKYRIIAISTTEPYDIVEFEIPLEVMEKVKEELSNLYEKAHEVILFDIKKGYSNDIVRVEYPTYYKDFK